jgi:pimeloyl-ACP methyl ester carboxylesterase
VLVHGAFAENPVMGSLGLLALTLLFGIGFANPLRGLQQDAAYLRSVLDSLSGPVVIAGHSYGGSVMSEAADGAPGVAALVYIASFSLGGRGADGGHPAAHRRLRPGGQGHQGGLEDHPVLDHGHHPGPGHPAVSNPGAVADLIHQAARATTP